ncbi:hypothetical protein AS034_20435 [[Bacillus] enclensis]|nr:hypothetical protein AS034_20435 [[Bacillus] enclensis]OAT85172.1 hypothetical protein A6P54_19270 [Bacillus sp. MKU004]OIU73043.1 hypothetical protein BHE18_00430 [Rossellomorea aquimaris]QTC44025.1 hypothetical protein I7V34_17820 [Bacillus sp. V3]QWC24790.1 hypothetical protein KJK41_01200 [Bacillus haikouensis]
MFDVQTLMEIRKKADEISYRCMSGDRPSDLYNINLALDQVSRALAMFAEMEIHRMQNTHIACDGQSYIKGRLRIAYRSILPQEEESNTA